MTTARRARSDSLSAKLQVARSAGKQIQAPSTVKLTKEQMPFFVNVVDEFARSEWSPHCLELAAMLARDLAMVESEQRLLAKEGTVVKTAKGHLMPNPRASILATLKNGILAHRRSLSLHARARVGEARDAGRRKQVQKGIERELEDDGDGLLN